MKLVEELGQRKHDVNGKGKKKKCHALTLYFNNLRILQKLLDIGFFFYYILNSLWFKES